MWRGKIAKTNGEAKDADVVATVLVANESKSWMVGGNNESRSNEMLLRGLKHLWASMIRCKRFVIYFEFDLVLPVVRNKLIYIVISKLRNFNNPMF